MNPESLTKNKFIDQCLKIVPDDPVSQSRYIYYLTTIVFCGLIGFSISTWFQVFYYFDFTTLFRGIFMTAISMLSLFGVKQTRNAYLTTRSMYKSVTENVKEQEMIIESVKEMQKEFKK